MKDTLEKKLNHLPINLTPNTFISDQQLVAQALKNDQQALALLVKRHLKLVYNIARYYVLNSDDAKDVTQEVFVKVWKNLKKFRLEKSFTSWIFEIAKNTALDWLKKKKTVLFSNFENESGKNYLSETIADLSPTPYEMASRTETIKTLQLAINQLPPLYQEVVIRHSQEEMTFQEIADSTKQSINTVKSRYLRALALLKKFLTEI